MGKPIKAVIVSVISLVTIGLTLLDQTHLTIDNTPYLPENHTSFALVPNVEFNLLKGGSIALHSLSGHTLWLHFWASWCIPCRSEFTDLLKRLTDKDNSNTILLAVSGDKEAQNAKQFILPLQKQFRQLFDSGRVIIAYDPQHTLIEGVFQTFQYPETIIIDKNLSMQRKVIGIFKD